MTKIDSKSFFKNTKFSSKISVVYYSNYLKK